MHLVFRRIANNMESRCDQRGLERLEGDARRAYGILRYARRLSYEEFMGLWSDCMMGAEEQGLSARGMKEILNAGQPSQLNLGDWNQEMPVDARRAEAVRNLLVSMEQEKQK